MQVRGALPGLPCFPSSQASPRQAEDGEPRTRVYIVGNIIIWIPDSALNSSGFRNPDNSELLSILDTACTK